MKALHEKFSGDHDAFIAALLELKAKESPFPKTPLSLLIDHIEHIAKVAGIDHVGLGSDFDGVDSLPEGLTGIEALPKITFELLKRGHSEEDVRKILSGDGNTKSISVGSADAGK